MSAEQFTLESLKEMDGGKAFLAFQRHLQRAAADCLDRPADASPRTVTLKLALKPQIDPEGDCTEVKSQIFVESVVPKHRTKVYSFGLRKNGILTFNNDSLDNVNQKTFLPGEEK